MMHSPIESRIEKLEAKLAAMKKNTADLLRRVNDIRFILSHAQASNAARARVAGR